MTCLARSQMKRHVQDMLQFLREAIHEAIAESPHVAAAMAELERAGHVPTFSVEVALPEEGFASADFELPAGHLLLTESDEQFLNEVGIDVPE